MNPKLRPLFWENYSLEELTPEEWEALCDGCGKCCLVKLEDEDTREIAYTCVSCQLLDHRTGHCSNYENRREFVPDCLTLTPALVRTLHWLPSTCAYRRLAEKRPLPEWHYLLTGDRNCVMAAGQSVAGRCTSETRVAPDRVEEYIIRWVK